MQAGLGQNRLHQKPTKMKRVPKTVLVTGILAIGMAAALPFHKRQPIDQAIHKTSPESLVLRRHMNLQITPDSLVDSTGPGGGQATGRWGGSAVIRGKPLSDVLGTTDGERAPHLSGAYQPFTPAKGQDLEPAARKSNQSAADKNKIKGHSAAAQSEPTPSPASDVSAGRHTIRDGDNLRELARRYLGDSDLYLVLYEWNRGVLAHPDILPIGCEIRIPHVEAMTNDEIPNDERMTNDEVPNDERMTNDK